MFKKMFLLPVLLIGISTVLFTGCSSDDDDTTPPVVTLNGDPAPVLFLQTNFVDLGATAVDNKDGNLAVTVDGMVDKNKTGSYPLVYSATDNSGNTGTATRVVTYKNELTNEPYAGNYNCTIDSSGQTVWTYSESLAISTTLNNAVEWSKFGDYGNANAKLNMFIQGSSQISIPTQTIICGNPAVARTFSGSGTYSGGGGTGSTIVLNITETVNSVSAQFTYTYTKN
jgi:hypothetical protein